MEVMVVTGGDGGEWKLRDPLTYWLGQKGKSNVDSGVGWPVGSQALEK